MCMTVFLSYLPEAGQYSCMFLYLKQVSALNHLLHVYIFFNSVFLKKAKIQPVYNDVLVWIEIYDQLKFNKHQSASSASILVCKTMLITEKFFLSYEIAV